MEINFNNMSWTIRFTDDQNSFTNHSFNSRNLFSIDFASLTILLYAGENEYVNWVNTVNAVSRAIAFSHGVNIANEDSAFEFISKYLDDVMSASYFIYKETYEEIPPVFAE